MTAAPVSVVDEGFDVEFMESGGVVRRADLSTCWDVRFEDALPVRSFPSVRGQAHFPGLRWSATSGRHVGYESWLERDHAMLLDFDLAVVGYSSQPFWLRWHDGRRRRRHAPDFFVRLIDGKGVVVEWLIAGWQNRRHDGLRDPVSPGRTFTPNEKYASLVQAAGYIAVALSADDYIELLPASWRAINHYGVKIGRRTYDSNELNPLRRQPSGVQDKKNLWEVHRDPYDVCRVWIRNHHDGGWITLFWKHLNSMPTPFGELAWNHALAGLLGQGGNPTEDEIGQAAADLLDRAHRGPPSPQAATSVGGTKASRRDQRIAARTRAAGPALPAATQPAVPGAPAVDDPAPETEAPAHDVVPLGVFDARQEANTWW